MNDRNITREVAQWEADHSADRGRVSHEVRNALLLWLVCVAAFVVAVTL